MSNPNLDIARELNRMGVRDETLRKIMVTCMIFAALASAAQTIDNMVEKSWRRRIQEEDRAHTVRSR